MTDDRWPRVGDRCPECATADLDQLTPRLLRCIACLAVIEMPDHVLLDRAGTPRLPGLEGL